MRIAAMTIAVVGLALSAVTVPPLAAQGQTSIGVDADPEGNSATTLGAVQDCRGVEVNGTLKIDVFVRDVPAIDGFQFDLVYDSTKVKVTAVDNLQMLSAGGATQPVDFSEEVPDTDGTFTVAFADFGPNSESGDGVLSRITLEALAKGQSGAALTNVTLTNSAQTGVNFAQLIFSANIAVGESCTPPPSPVPVPETPAADQGTPPADQATPEPTAQRETPAPPPATPDADGDGTADANDQCDDTPAGVTADASGCSDTQLEKVKEETKEQLVEGATAGLNLDVALDTVVVSGSTDVVAVFADQNDDPVPGVDVTFKIEEQPGSDANLNGEGETEVTKTSGADGVAEAKLDVGNTPGEIVVSATAEGETETVTVTVVEAAAPGPGAPTAGSPEPEGPAEAIGAGDDGGLGTAGWAALGGGLGGAALLLAGAALLWARRRRA